MTYYQDTIAALATPTGNAAIAIVRASGGECVRLAKEICGVAPPPRIVQHRDYPASTGTLIDDVVVTFFRGPHSYTGEDSLEISCHGNPFIVQKILTDLFGRGCRPAEPGEFTRRAFLNGKIDLSQAEAVIDLIHARGERALAMANQQLRGALSRKMTELVDGIVETLARVEAYIDFPEEDLPLEETAIIARTLDRLAKETDRLLATSQYGATLRDGIKTVIIGAPNVGKSSLLNRFVGRDRALVSPEPGTTRDFIEERILVGGHCLRIIDTAGLNDAPGPIEQRGIEKSFEQAADADLLLVVLDATQPLRFLPEAISGKLQPQRTIGILNKIDLVSGNSSPKEFVGIRLLGLSATKGTGWDELIREMTQKADSFQRDLGGDSIAINARHSNSLGVAREALNSAIVKLTENVSTELLASDLRAVIGAYGEICGEIDNEVMLDELFSRFCIGK